MVNLYDELYGAYGAVEIGELHKEELEIKAPKLWVHIKHEIERFKFKEQLDSVDDSKIILTLEEDGIVVWLFLEPGVLDIASLHKGIGVPEEEVEFIKERINLY